MTKEAIVIGVNLENSAVNPHVAFSTPQVTTDDEGSDRHRRQSCKQHRGCGPFQSCPFPRFCRSFRIANASDKRYFAESSPFLKCNAGWVALFCPKHPFLSPKMPNKAAHLRYNFKSSVSSKISSVACVSLRSARQKVSPRPAERQSLPSPKMTKNPDA